MSITFYECVFIVFGIQHAMSVRHIVICGLSGSIVIFHIFSQRTRFSKKMLLNINCVSWFPLSYCLKHFSFSEEFNEIWSKMCTGFHVKYPVIVFFLLGDSPASDLYMLTFRNTLSVPSSKAHLPLKMEQIECSETSAYINQTPGNHPKENKLHSEHGESLKSRIPGYSCQNLMKLKKLQFSVHILENI